MGTVMISWKGFVEKAAELINLGGDDVAISRELGSREYTWSGTIQDLKLGEEYSPGVQMKMPEIRINLSNGNFIKASYLFLNTDSETERSWLTAKIGDAVTFTTTIKAEEGPFPAVQASIDNEDPEVLLLIGASNAIKV